MAKMKVLVVDDEEDVQFLLHDNLMLHLFKLLQGLF